MPDDSRDTLISPTSFTTDQIIKLWTDTSKRFGGSRKRISYCHGIQSGDIGFERPDVAPNFRDRDAPDPLESKLPHRKSLVADLVNRLSASKPRLERRAIGQTQQARDDAQECQTWIQTAVERALDTDECYLKSGEDGEWATVTLPDTAHFEICPSFMDSLTAEDYAEAKPEQKKGYRKAGDRYERVKPIHWRSKNGKATDEPKERDRGETRKAYDESYTAYLADIPPWVCRIIPALDCAPILVRGRDRRRFVCRGLVVRTLYDESELLDQGYVWDRPGRDNIGWAERIRALVPRGATSGTYGQAGRVYLYEAYLNIKNKDGGYTPIVAYSVGGTRTTWKKGDDDEQVDAIINLEEEYGLCDITDHIGYWYGLHTGHDDPDSRGFPLLHPYGSLIVSVESKMTATNVHAIKTGYSGVLIELLPDAMTQMDRFLEENGSMKKWELPASGQIMPIPGKPYAAPTPEVSDTVRYQLQNELMILGTEQPSKELSGSETDRSGHSLSISANLAALADRQIPEGVRQCLEHTGIAILKIAQAIYAKNGIRVPLQVNEEVEPEADSPGESYARWRIVEYTPRWTGDGTTFALTGIFPDAGNIAEIEQEKNLALAGFSWTERVLEKMGVTNIQASLAKIDAEAVLKTPAGQLERLSRMFAYRGEQEKSKMLELQARQLLSEAGMPVDAMGLSAGAPQGAQEGLTGMGNPAGSALAGIVGGGTGAASINADAQAQAEMAPSGAALNGAGGY